MQHMFLLNFGPLLLLVLSLLLSPSLLLCSVNPTKLTSLVSCSLPKVVGREVSGRERIFDSFSSATPTSRAKAGVEIDPPRRSLFADSEGGSGGSDITASLKLAAASEHGNLGSSIKCSNTETPLWNALDGEDEEVIVIIILSQRKFFFVIWCEKTVAASWM